MKEKVKLKDITTMVLTSSDEPSPPARRITSQRSYKVTKGLQKTRRGPLINKHNTKSTAAKKTTTGSSTTKTEDDASQTAAPTDNTKSSIHRAIQDTGEREGIETSKAYDEMSIQLNKLNESASQVYNQTVNGLALTQTKAAKSLKELMKGYEEEREGEGEEVLYV